jgi:hypothetical protein
MNREQTLRRSENQQPQKERFAKENCHFLFMLVCERQVFSCWFLFTKLENWIDTINQSRIYKIVSFYKENY